MKRLLLLLLILVINVQLCTAQDSLIFVIRVDDVLSRNTTYIPRSIKPFEQAVEKRGGKVTWAVIPNRLIETQNKDGVLARELKESIQSGHEAALHGYVHICQVCNNSGHEMYCPSTKTHLTYEKQLKLIDDGLKILADSIGAKPSLFVPPGHEADTTTFKVLADKGISYLSSTGGTKNYIYENLYNLQQNNEYTWSITMSNYSQQLHAALEDIRTAGRANGYYCLLLHDPFIRQGYQNGITVNWISELLDSLNFSYSGRVKYMTLSSAAGYFKNSIVSAAREEDVLYDYALSNNYPNPFNPETKIDFRIAEEAMVVIKILNIAGQEVRTILEQELKPGQHTVRWDGRLNNGSKAAGGIYIYRIQTSGFTAAKKMILLQ